MQGNFINGWREVLARVFEGFEIEYGVTPEWLVNPDTNRRLKLDYLLPEVGLAVRFTGLEGAGQRRRKSDQEVESEADRERARAEVCRQNGIALVSLDPFGDPGVALRGLEMALARASSQVARGGLPQKRKQALMPLLSEARRKTGEFTTRLNPPERLNMYAEMWSERQDNLRSTAPPPPPKKSPGKAPAYTVGMEVVHERFGLGQVTAIEPEGADQAISVDFVQAGARRLLASLVADKMQPA